MSGSVIENRKNDRRRRTEIKSPSNQILIKGVQSTSMDPRPSRYYGKTNYHAWSKGRGTQSSRRLRKK